MISLSGKRVLLIKPSSLGDVVHAATSAWSLKSRWPDCHLSWLVNKSFEPIVAPMACVDETIAFDRARFRGLAAFGGNGELQRLIRDLRNRFDVVVDLQGLLRSGVFGFLSQAPVRVGESSAREGAPLFYTHTVETPEQPVHARDRYATIMRVLGCTDSNREDLDVTDDERASIRGRLPENIRDGFVAVCVGARWESKQAPVDKWVPAIQATGLPWVLTGSPDQSALCASLESLLDGTTGVNLCGQTDLRELAAVLDVADVMFTVDSGPMHMAAAQGTPVVALFGPTDPRRTGPYGQLGNVVRGDCELMPCLKRECPGQGDKCMKQLDPQSLVTVARRVLGR